MASVSNVRLQIGREEEGDRRRVTVTYRICFTACEVLAGSTYVEHVTLRGADDWSPDDHLVTLRNSCIRAERGCVDRTISALVSESSIDEDGDTIIFGWVINRDRDEVYARVRLVPFTTSTVQADSNEVTGQFGPD